MRKLAFIIIVVFSSCTVTNNYYYAPKKEGTKTIIEDKGFIINPKDYDIMPLDSN